MFKQITSFLFSIIYDIGDALYRLLRTIIFAISLILLFLMIAIITGLLYVYRHYTRPDIDFNNVTSFAQSSHIYDRNGIELYSFFQEDRQYVHIDDISPYMIQAIISAEDKTYRYNDGYDIEAIARSAWINFIQRFNHGKINELQGGSTITQQLIKNIKLTKHKTIERKITEIILSRQLTHTIINQIIYRNPHLSFKQSKYQAKRAILELYLNYIYLGNHAYGIQSASQKYFKKSAKELTILESSILASLPKAPSTYDPFIYPGRLMGQRKATIGTGQKNVTIPLEFYDTLHNHIEQQRTIYKQNHNNYQDNHIDNIQSFLHTLGSFTLSLKNHKKLYIEYTPGRKDYVLNQMYQNNYINIDDVMNAFIQSTNIHFQTINFPIKAPHFVYWVRESILHNPIFEDLGINEDILSKGGLQIVTSLDYPLQQQIQQLMNNNQFLLHYYKGNNRAVMVTDTNNGDVLSYIGSMDFRNDDIEGKNDMIRSHRQPGSTIKPFIYAYGMMKYKLGPQNKILDAQYSIGDYKPHNADGKFRGYTTIAKALAGSRNIPAIKTFQANGGENIMKPFLQKLGMKSLQNDHYYGPSLAIGAGEITMLELAQAYLHLAGENHIPQINPIIQIKNNKGEVIYEKKDKNTYVPKLIPNGVSRLIRSILSEHHNAPSGRYNMLHMPGLEHYAIKTGTSDKKIIDKKGKVVSRPRDGWIIFYNPSRVITIWAGNTDGSAMKNKGFGGTINAPLLQDITKMMIKSGYIDDIDKAYPENELDEGGHYKYPTNDRRPRDIAK